MDYVKLLDEIGRDNFYSRQKELSESIRKFLNEAKYPDSYICNVRILTHALLDYYADITRLKSFHEIKHTKTSKVIAYKIYWILRRKPIQIIEYSEVEHDIFVNERYACNLLVSECLIGNDVNITDESVLEDVDKYTDLLLYYFKYRQLNPQVIELLIESFKIGYELKGL
ncbi:MAG: hypothetical protein IJ141_08335 [Lachnospiraceae bacterium]|nr:hypothetical protein [Lachnospiraceae bacterium]